jgi:hypothetical protein
MISFSFYSYEIGFTFSILARIIMFLDANKDAV